MTDVYVLDAVRTPIGRYGGALAGVRPDDLAAHVVRALTTRAPALDPARIDDVFFGDANGAGEDNRNVARMAALLAGLPTSRPGRDASTGSADRDSRPSIAANRAVAVGDASLVVAGGVESMSRAPWVLPKPAQGLPGRPRDAALDHARLADGQPEHAGRLDGLARRGDRAARREVRHHPRGAGRVRARAATSAPPRPGTPACTTTRSSRCPASSSTATSRSAPAPRSRRWPGSSRRSARTAR